MIVLPEYCDKCGRRGRVFDSKKRKGYRRRMRRCPFCGHEWPEYSSRLNPAKAIHRVTRRQARAPRRSN